MINEQPEQRPPEWMPVPRYFPLSKLAAVTDWLSVPILAEWMTILLAALLYGGRALLNLDSRILQLSGEHPESATLPLLAEIGLKRYGEIPLWNPYMTTGFPHAGDLINHFWHPISTLPILIWGGINGMKISIFIAFIVAGMGQWVLGRLFGLRGMFRLWSSLMFLLCGGLAMLWRLGWYELLLGVAWFPWSFAALWWALQRRDRTSLVLAAIPVVMVLSTGGGYYPFYLGGSLIVLTLTALVMGAGGGRGQILIRAGVVALLSTGVLAVMMAPMLDVLRLATRLVGMDTNQEGSQPIAYALVNYIVSKPEWYSSSILGQKGGWNWFYIGAIPIGALGLAPLALRVKRYRTAIIVLGVLSIILLAWSGNRYTPMRLIYDWIPTLYYLRFPNRLLILATSPLLIVAGLGLQYVTERWQRQVRGVVVGVSRWVEEPRPIRLLPLSWLVQGMMGLVLVYTVWDVYSVNRPLAFLPEALDPRSFAAMKWLKSNDPGLYYIDVGGAVPGFPWLPAIYDAEMPMINFVYGRLLRERDRQMQPGSPFTARAKYMFVVNGQPKPVGGEKLTDFDGIELWRIPDVLPYAFTVATSLVETNAHLKRSDVTEMKARIDGPNRVIVEGTMTSDSHLVVLMNDYPGWKLRIDNTPAALASVNGYLGAVAPSGSHVFVFEFHPASHDIGLAISLLTLVVMVGLVLLDRVPRFRREQA
ncbi:MAG: hypothetical protein KIT87_01050 [Anaerolineae bacterium]|nr:hypothetical protein [Anaerolineae bacterium]